MRHPHHYLKRPMDWVFSAPSHVGILRALKDAREGMSGRAVARAAGFTHQACRQAFAKLEALGLLERQGSGKTQLMRLNFENALVAEAILPLFRAERRALSALRGLIRQEFEGRARAATLFGSVARKEEKPGSDVDLLLVADGAAKSSLSERAAALGRRTSSRFGLRLSAIVLTPAELRRRARRSDPLIKNILSEGIDLLDARLAELL